MPRRFKWKEPPPETHRSGRTDQRVVAMRRHPKRWLVWSDKTNRGAASTLNKNHPGFEFVARNHRVEDGRMVATIYARFLGEVESDGV